MGIDLGAEGAPDETTRCKLRHLLERNNLGKMLLTAVNAGTIIDATIIGAPSSTKNKDAENPQNPNPDEIPAERAYRA